MSKRILIISYTCAIGLLPLVLDVLTSPGWRHFYFDTHGNFVNCPPRPVIGECILICFHQYFGRRLFYLALPGISLGLFVGILMSRPPASEKIRRANLAALWCPLIGAVTLSLATVLSLDRLVWEWIVLWLGILIFTAYVFIYPLYVLLLEFVEKRRKPSLLVTTTLGALITLLPMCLISSPGILRVLSSWRFNELVNPLPFFLFFAASGAVGGALHYQLSESDR